MIAVDGPTPYGSWPSPVTPDLLTAGALGLGAPKLDRGSVYWAQARPDEGGRISVWRHNLNASDRLIELTPAPAYVRSRVQEYGGGAWDVGGGIVAWSNYPDGVVWIRSGDEEPRAITPAGRGWRFADLRVHPDRGLLLAVREAHLEDGSEAVTTLVALDLAGSNEDGGRVLCGGADFYSTPELSGDGRLAWVQWNHPDMPWDATSLRVATLDGSGLGEVTVIAGGSTDPQFRESVVQPRWLPGGGLVYCSDRTGWWNLYLWTPDRTRPLHPQPGEFSEPQWKLGQQPYAVIDANTLLCTWGDDTGGHLGLLHIEAEQLVELGGPGTSYGGVAAEGKLVAVLAGSSLAPASVQLGQLAGVGEGIGEVMTWRRLQRASEVELPAGMVAEAEPVTWEGRTGLVHGWFYPPVHPEAVAPEGERPPLVTLIHGGPTAAAATALDLEVQYWTSRGIAVLDVDYSGSTGYGRAYRERLRGRWGELDVTDCADGALAMAAAGRVDGRRLAIMGGSAGGYTVLRALTTTEAFAAGISLYGVGDLTALAEQTHKFESRYLDGLVGPYPQEAATYVARSPIAHVDDLASPILLLQGGEDRVVPPNQAEAFAAAARVKGLPVALLIFPDEGHGFRRAENIRASLAAELAFLGQVFGFVPADDLPPLPLETSP